MKITKVELHSYSTEPDWMIAAKSRMIDRAMPYPEEIRLRPAKTVSGSLKIWIEKNAQLDSKQSMFDKVKERLLVNKDESLCVAEPGYVLDLRLKTPSNWAHAFTNHLPLALLIAKHTTESNLSKISVIFPKDLPSKISELFLSMGFSVLTTKSAVSGDIIRFKVDPWLAIRGERTALIKELVPESFVRKVKKMEVDTGLNKVYLARKNTRSIKNEDDLDNELKHKGFRKIYLEEYSLLEQISILSRAKDIVAVHGASLGPLIMRSAINVEPYRLMEIFSPAHVSNVYRVITSQQKGHWVGVRGVPWPDLLGKNPDYGKNLKDFYVDMDSIRHALSIF